MAARARGLFVTFEGPEGSGKSTQIERLAHALREHGRSVVVTREPGGTRIGDQIRRIVLGRDNPEIVPAAEVLLFSAARAQHVAERIRPALDAGSIVLCDRFADSTLAYQGYGLGFNLDLLRAITQFATSGLAPDLTIYLDLSVQVGLERKARAAGTGGEWNRLDQRVVEYHERVRRGYLDLAAAEPNRWLVIDAGPPAEVVEPMIRAQVEARLVEGEWTPSSPR